MSPSAAAAALALLAVNAFFVAAEFALLSARRSRIEQLASDGDGRAVSALAGMRELSLMLAGAQLGITMASLGLGAVAEPALASVLEGLFERAHVPEALLHPLAFTIALSVVVFLHMVVGEMAPKSWAISDPERSVLVLARPFRAFAVAVRPVISVLNWLANGVVRLFGLTPQEELASVHAPSDLLLLLEESARQGTLQRDQHHLLTRALEVSGLDAQAVMVPRRDIVAVPLGADVAGIEHAASTSGRSRLPAFDGDLDRVEGIVHVKDLLRLDLNERGVATAATLARPAFVTVESRPIEDLLLDMRKARTQVALVVDEYGSVTGLVTVADLLEELLGHLASHDAGGRDGSVRQRADGAFVVPGALRLDEAEERTGVALPPGGYETVAGYVLAELGRVPKAGDTVSSRAGVLEVTRMDGTRVVELALHRAAD